MKWSQLSSKLAWIIYITLTWAGPGAVTAALPSKSLVGQSGWAFFKLSETGTADLLVLDLRKAVTKSSLTCWEFFSSGDLVRWSLFVRDVTEPLVLGHRGAEQSDINCCIQTQQVQDVFHNQQINFQGVSEIWELVNPINVRRKRK